MSEIDPPPTFDTPTTDRDAAVPDFFRMLAQGMQGLPWFPHEREILINCLREAKDKNPGKGLFKYEFHEAFHRLYIDPYVKQQQQSSAEDVKVGLLFDILLAFLPQVVTRPPPLYQEPSPAAPDTTDGSPCYDDDFWQKQFERLLRVLDAFGTPKYDAVELATRSIESDSSPLLSRLGNQRPLSTTVSLEILVQNS